jgi:teichuronic acid biosynthesis glycosyltransferase TuaC
LNIGRDYIVGNLLMRVCMVTPHLPPEQSANALLPALLGDALAARGIVTEYVAHPSRAEVDLKVGAPSAATYVPRRGPDRFSRSRLGAVVSGTRMALGAGRTIGASDLIHLHGNGFIVEIGAWLAKRHRKPYVITLYGTDISAYDATRNARFGRVVREAACRVFYSRGLLQHAERIGLSPHPSTVIYAPVNSAFHPVDEETRQSIRRQLGITDEPLLLTVKRLHPVAGHEIVLRAMPSILAAFPNTRLWIAGDGPLRGELERQAQDLKIQSHVRFLGRLDNTSLPRYYAAADLFVLPSEVESWGTVMLEALACGTPVVTTDTIGGVEVRDRFPEDVQVVQKGRPEDLAAAVCVELQQRRRTTGDALRRIQTAFSVDACATQYLDVYKGALGARP